MYIASADISLYHLGSTVFRAELTFPGATGRDTASAWQASKSFQVISAPSSRHDWVKISSQWQNFHWYPCGKNIPIRKLCAQRSRIFY